MTAVECLHAVKVALWHVFTMRGLTWLQRLQLSLLKIVAVLGYHHGKVKALQALSPGARTSVSKEPKATVKYVVFPVMPLRPRARR